MKAKKIEPLNDHPLWHDVYCVGGVLHVIYDPCDTRFDARISIRPCICGSVEVELPEEIHRRVLEYARERGIRLPEE